MKKTKIEQLFATYIAKKKAAGALHNKVGKGDNRAVNAYSEALKAEQRAWHNFWGLYKDFRHSWKIDGEKLVPTREMAAHLGRKHTPSKKSPTAPKKRRT